MAKTFFPVEKCSLMVATGETQQIQSLSMSYQHTDLVLDISNMDFINEIFCGDL